MNKKFKTKFVGHSVKGDADYYASWELNGITNSECSKEFMSDAGEVVKLSDAAGNEWVKVNPTTIPDIN